MSRHLADHRAQTDGGRVKHFCRIEKSGGGDGNHEVVRTLHKRAPVRGASGRVGHFIRIERGLTA